MILKKDGFIEIICGPMFSGKTTKLIEKINFFKKSGINFLVFKPSIDNRYSQKGELVTHNLQKIPSLLIDRSKEIINFIKEETEALIIDEVQFLDKEIETILNDLSYKGLKIIIGGLEMDFCGRPFGSMGYLLSIADRVWKLKSYCAVCGKEASRVQRIVDGKIPSSREPVILVGNGSFHEPRCRNCHKFTV